MPHRSPIIVCLLLAFMVGANIAVYRWMQSATPLGAGTVAYFALLEAQLAVVCVWSAMRTKNGPLNWIAPIAAVIACSYGFSLIDATNGAIDILPYFGIYAALLLIALWVLRRTAFWRRRTGAQNEWKFSIAQMLVLMTLVAVLTSALRFSTLFEDSWIVEAALLCGAVIVAVASVVFWTLKCNPVLRLAGACGVALVCGGLFYFAGSFLLVFALIAYLVQAAILSLWLALGGILPVAPIAATLTPTSE